ncbi:VOC family protein [Cellulomonas endophytica]|uniref:VOC family protein n=1 Tax=Cellulomonas endophytica TaxID=2494735 RepID=UPI001012A060|nr:VOC family protein [Cellulomonas endophytica]
MPTAPTPGSGAAVRTPLPHAPRRDAIADATAMDAVTLFVGDLDRQLWFYRDVLALEVLEGGTAATERVAAGDRPDVVVLGRRGTPLVVLRHTPGLPPVRRREAGLFHTALLFDDRAGLAATLASVARLAPQTYVGSADHLVSLAFYLTDPEGNGVELYWDRSREEWQRTPEGGVVMGSLRLDPTAFLDEHLAGRPGAVPAGGGAVVGHVHLQVGDVPTARAFYVDALGFDVTAEWHGALFVSAGGYHHHLAMNTWNSAGAGPRASSLGLGEVRITVPGADDLGALADRVRHAGVVAVPEGASLRFEDPWRNVVRVGTAA